MVQTSLTSAAGRLPPSPASFPGDRVLPRFLLGAALNLFVVVPVSALLADGRPAGVALGVGSFLCLQAFAAFLMRRHYPHERLGLCNVVTQFRSGLIAAFTAPLAVPGLLAQDSVLGWSLLGLALLALLLDGVDGFLARRSGLVSRFGARFDVEMDSILALILALLVLQSGKAGLWVLVLGVMRYLFVVAGMALPWLNADLPERFSRKAICVIQIATLIALLAPFITPPFAWWLAAAASALLVWSFAVDVIWLARNRAR